jgi:uncharacterized membrane protein
MKVRDYFASVLDSMAKGLFASLIVGVIIKQLGVITGLDAMRDLGQFAQYFMGPCIGAGVAHARGTKQFGMLAAIVAGAIGAGMIKFTGEAWTVAVGEPVGALVAALAGVELGKLLEGRTKFDLLIVPAAVITAGAIIGTFVSPVIASALTAVGMFVNRITEMHPIPMGILLGIIVGVILTLPVSSAALCISIKISGLAAGAALAGCCAQMIGFAVSSFRENKASGLVAQGLGTSMLQVPNIIKNPWIWLPPTIASGVCGLLATTVFRMETTSVGAGMGTSGLVGQLATYEVMGAAALIPMIILHFLLPAAISLPINEVMRRKGLIKAGDMKL